MNGCSHVFWLFGLSGAGKSTLADALSHDLFSEHGEKVLRLDGDRLRSGLSSGLGFSDADRTENLRRAAQVARLGIESGLVVVAAFITPQIIQRGAIESIIGTSSVSFIYVDADLATCQRRDVKGLYAGAAKGAVKQMTGVSARFEPPLTPPALWLQTGSEDAEQSFGKLKLFVRQKLERLAALPRR
ncbi:MAG TPA: adenylyl-sulfate kinase [Lacunisphaera sp.]|jgi:adenylyl-sulfate kinase